MLLLDSGILTRVMKMVHPPVLLTQNCSNIIVNSVMGSTFPMGFTMSVPNGTCVIPTAMVAKVFLSKDQSVIVGRYQSETIRVLSEEYLEINLLGHFPALI